MNNDFFLNVANEMLLQQNKQWTTLGVLDKNDVIHSFGHDSKILGRIFELLTHETLLDIGARLSWELYENSVQTIYPDFYFVKPSGRKVAIDIKSTYRTFGSHKRFAFTAGSFTSYLRNGTKNIVGHYHDYDKHYIIGIAYERELEASFGRTPLSERHTIQAAYKNIEVFVQEKYRICSDKKGSGNTDNIGTIAAHSINTFREGRGPFYFLGEDVFHHYWKNHPKYNDPPEIKQMLYSGLPEYFDWLDFQGKDSRSLRLCYQEYLDYIASNPKN